MHASAKLCSNASGVYKLGECYNYPLSKHNRHSREGGNTLQQDHLTSNQERSIGLHMTPACHQNLAVGMADHRVGDAAHQGPLHPTEPTPAHHYESGSKLFGQRHALLARTPVPQVFFRDLRPCIAHLLGLLVKKST